MKENNFQKACIKYCKSEGLYHIAIRGGKISKGSPTLVLCLNGKFVAFDMGDSLDDGRHRTKIQANGGKYYSPRNLEEFVAIIRAIQRQEKR